MSIETAVALISAVVTLIAVIVSVFTLAQSARKDAFMQLQSIVEQLKKDLKEARDENERLLKEREELNERIDAQDSLIAALRAELDQMKRQKKAK